MHLSTTQFAVADSASVEYQVGSKFGTQHVVEEFEGQLPLASFLARVDRCTVADDVWRELCFWHGAEPMLNLDP